MGNEESEFDSDLKNMRLKGDLNIYICGVRDYGYFEKILQEAFPNEGPISSIKLENKNADYYKEGEYFYEYRTLKFEYQNNGKTEIKKYNIYIFLNDIDGEFSDILMYFIYEKDIDNKRNNVIISYGGESFITESINKIPQKSKKSIPFLIFVKGIPFYDEKLKYINYIPDFNIIKHALGINNRNNLSEKEIIKLSEKILLNFIKAKLYRMDMYYNQMGYNLNMVNAINDLNAKIKLHLTIAIVGYSGTGKSTLINLLFKELVSKAMSSSEDQTTKCTEYYLPIQNVNENDFNIGQIRFLDFPGISEDLYYEEVVEPEIKKKIKEYKENMEQIDIALFFISNGVGREFTKSGVKLVNLLNKNKIKIIFIINGKMDDDLLEVKKNNIIDLIKDKAIIRKDNIIHTNFYQNFDKISGEGISTILQKILEIIQIDPEFINIESININNYNEYLDLLKDNNRIFDICENTKTMKEIAKKKSSWLVAGYSALSCGTSALSLFAPFVDSITTIGYQVAMTYNILSIYELNPKNYNIIDIILSGGNSIKDINKLRIDNNNDNYKNELKNGKIREVIGDISKGGLVAGKYGIQYTGAKEAGKRIVTRTLKTVITETKDYSVNVFGKVIINPPKIVETTAKKSIEEVFIASSKELADKGIKEGSKVILKETAKDSADLSAKFLGIFEVFGKSNSKETIKEVTEEIVIKKGGKNWLINLGKAVPFISTGISAGINTYSTIKIGYNLINQFDKEFEENQQNKVNMLKGKLYALSNICEQLYNIMNGKE